MLISLDTEHAAALERFLCQFDDAPETLHGYFPERGLQIDNVVELLDAWAVGEQLPDGWVPCTTRFWETGGELAGVINIRHHLSEGLRIEGGSIGYSVAPSFRGRGIATEMLRSTLPLCRELRIERALLTVDTANVASWKTVENNGGILEREGLAGDGAPMRYYWIDV